MQKRREPAVPAGTAVKGCMAVGRQLCEALSVAHAAGADGAQQDGSVLLAAGAFA